MAIAEECAWVAEWQACELILNSSSSQTSTLEEALTYAEKSFTRARNAFDEVIFVLNWIGFKDNRIALNMRLSLACNFLPEKFKVSCWIGEATKDDNTTRPVLFQSLYKTEYDQAQIHEINYQLASKVYDFIAAKLAEADTPPA